MLQPIVFQFCFLRLKILTSFLELILQEFGGAGGLLLAGLQILVYEERSDLIRYLSNQARVVAAVADPKSLKILTPAKITDHLNRDIGSHQGDHVLTSELLSFLWIQIERLDDLLQACGTEDLLRQGTEAIAYVPGNGGLHIRIRDLLRIHQDHSLRSVHVRQEMGDNRCGERNRQSHSQDQPLPADQKTQVMLRGQPSVLRDHLWPAYRRAAARISHFPVDQQPTGQSVSRACYLRGFYNL